ncbi:hypothetical protein GSI_03775 [Ganoderma sinense ZZ0214-1]|uniref:Uncharacterized protein n=1 Tax=Ganoderma sinense ZZ0214-1 TaxID=1077348 RepID=A0A2G8SJX4_9APHY|nr:hypothetical protein GSI_03775 [Ganoderma sinense ZZ0214-1]
MSDDATATPVAVAPSVDTAAVRELLGMMKATLGQLDQTFRTLNEQSAQVKSLGPTMELAVGQLSSLRHQIHAQEKKQEVRVEEIRRMIREDIKLKVADEMREQIRKQVPLEIAKQAREQIGLQIRDVLPVSLKTQAKESRDYLEEVKHALENSEARRKNSVLKPSPNNLADGLAVVLKPDGTKSKLYPANLRSLFAYDYGKSKELVQDFGLHDHGVLEKNLNGFMAHIGIRFFLVPVPPTDATKTGGGAVLMPVSAK